MKKFSILSMILIWSIASFSQTQGVSLSHSTPLTGKAKSKYKIEAINEAFINLCLEANKKELENSDADPADESKTGEQKEELTRTVFKKNIGDDLRVKAIKDENENGETEKIARIFFKHSPFEYWIEHHTDKNKNTSLSIIKANYNRIKAYYNSKIYNDNGNDEPISQKVFVKNNEAEVITDEKEIEKFNTLFISYLEDKGFNVDTKGEISLKNPSGSKKWIITLSISEEKLNEISKNPEDHYDKEKFEKIFNEEIERMEEESENN